MTKNKTFQKGLQLWWWDFKIKNSNEGDNYETQYQNGSMISWWQW